MIETSLRLAEFPIEKYSLDTMIGRSFDGLELSRGEGQKLAAARAFYNRKAEIMIIDEPTAALDPIAKEQLYQLIIENSEDKTLFIVLIVWVQ